MFSFAMGYKWIIYFFAKKFIFNQTIFFSSKQKQHHFKPEDTIWSCVLLLDEDDNFLKRFFYMIGSPVVWGKEHFHFAAHLLYNLLHREHLVEVLSYMLSLYYVYIFECIAIRIRNGCYKFTHNTIQVRLSPTG